jgi:hypothetical protein
MGEVCPKKKKICIKAGKFLVSERIQAENFSACAQLFLEIKNRAYDGEFRGKSCEPFVIRYFLRTESQYKLHLIVCR